MMDSSLEKHLVALALCMNSPGKHNVLIKEELLSTSHRLNK